MTTLEQCRAVYKLLLDGKPRTASQIVQAVGFGTTASVTARVRDLRKPKYGQHNVVCFRQRGQSLYVLLPTNHLTALARHQSEEVTRTALLTG